MSYSWGTASHGQTYAVELIGGPADGKLLTVPGHALHRPVYVAIPPPILLPLLREVDLSGGPGLELPRPLEYHWDGTVRDDGVRPFRFRT